MPGNGLPRVAVLADDLTGALASAARLQRRGLRTIVQKEAPVHESLYAEAVVVNLATRERSGPGVLTLHDPQRTACLAADRLRKLGCRCFELRVDENLRGEPALELDGLLEGAALHDPCVIAVPAHPEAGRLTRRGAQVCFEPATLRGYEQEIASRLFRAQRSEVIALEAVRSEVESLGAYLRSRVGSGARRFIVDADREEDLCLVAQAVAEVQAERDVVTVSSGAWLSYHPPLVPGQSFVLVAIGSPTDVNDVQLGRLEARPRVKVLTAEDRVNLLDNRSSPAPALFGDHDCVVLAADEVADGDHRRVQVASEVAGHVEEILSAARMQAYSCAGVVASGAFTAQRVATALGAALVEPIAEPLPLCPIGALSGGPWAGLRIALKGGLIGGPDALIDLVTYLQQN